MTTDKTKNFFRVSAEDFKKIPGSPVAYWISHNLFDMLKGSLLSTHFKSGGRFKTCDDELFLRMWWEVSIFRRKWHPFFKGGDGRKYYGNEDRVINWSAEAQNFYYHNGGIGNKEFFGKIGITWSKISSSTQSFRIKSDSLFNSASSPVIFPSNQDDVYFIITYLNSYPVRYLLNMFNPTASLQVSDVLRLPFSNEWISQELTSQGKKQVAISKSDWNSYETSWDFQTNPLLTVGNRLNSGGNQFDLSVIYIALRRDWQRQTEEMRRLEIENNRIFIDAYGLQDELSPEVPWNEITLTYNPWYRYGKNIENFDVVCNDFVLAKKERIEIQPVNNNESDERPAEAFPFAQETEARLLEDTIKEFISYAVGCMMGRYSPEKPGLILANQGESFDDFIVKTVDSEQCAVDSKNDGTPESTTVTSSLTTDHYLPDREALSRFWTRNGLSMILSLSSNNFCDSPSARNTLPTIWILLKKRWARISVNTSSRISIKITFNAIKNVRFTGCSRLRKVRSTRSSICTVIVPIPSASF